MGIQAVRMAAYEDEVKGWLRNAEPTSNQPVRLLIPVGIKRLTGWFDVGGFDLDWFDVPGESEEDEEGRQEGQRRELAH